MLFLPNINKKTYIVSHYLIKFLLNDGYRPNILVNNYFHNKINKFTGVIIIFIVKNK